MKTNERNSTIFDNLPIFRHKSVHLFNVFYIIIRSFATHNADLFFILQNFSIYFQKYIALFNAA